MKNLAELTPKKYRCAFAAACPAVFKGEDGSYYIIGETLNPAAEGVPERVGSGETLVKIDGDLFAEVLKQEAAKQEPEGK